MIRQIFERMFRGTTAKKANAGQPKGSVPADRDAGKDSRKEAAEGKKAKAPKPVEITAQNLKPCKIEQAAIQESGPWLQRDYRLSGEYSYGNMLRLLEVAAAMADTVEHVWTASKVNEPEIDVTQAYRDAAGDVRKCAALQTEAGVISIGVQVPKIGPLKLVLMKQARVIRVFVPAGMSRSDREAVDQFVIHWTNRATEQK